MILDLHLKDMLLWEVPKWGGAAGKDASHEVFALAVGVAPELDRLREGSLGCKKGVHVFCANCWTNG